jgi:hypothetical protein
MSNGGIYSVMEWNGVQFYSSEAKVIQDQINNIRRHRLGTLLPRNPKIRTVEEEELDGNAKEATWMTRYAHSIAGKYGIGWR